MALNLANVQTSDTFQTWFTRTNQIISSAFPTTGGTITGSLTVDGDALFSGNTTIVNKTTIATSDALIQLAANNEFSDIVDIGFFGHYNSGSGNNHTGLIRDSGTKEYYLFGGYQPGAEPTSDININHASFELANVHVHTLTANTISGTVSGTFSGDGSGLTGVGITTATDTAASRTLRVPFTGFSSGLMTSANVNPTFTFNPATGTVAANNFVGDGAQLTNTETTVAVDGGANRSLSVPFTGITAGQLTSANTHSALLYNPSIGTLFATDFDSTSDERLKKNIKPIEGALDKVTKLVGVEFDWINSDKKSIGVIAQQVEEVVPELVHTNSKGFKSVSYGNLVALLIEAIKELSENSKTGNDQ